MKQIIILSFLFLLFGLPVQARRVKNEFRFQFNRVPTPSSNPTAEPTPTTAPTPTPKPAIMYPNDSNVRTFLNESTDNPASPPAQATLSAKLIVSPLRNKTDKQPDQNISIITSFLTFTVIAWASYVGLFNRGIFKKL